MEMSVGSVIKHHTAKDVLDNDLNVNDEVQFITPDHPGIYKITKIIPDIINTTGNQDYASFNKVKLVNIADNIVLDNNVESHNRLVKADNYNTYITKLAQDKANTERMIAERKIEEERKKPIVKSILSKSVKPNLESYISNKIDFANSDVFLLILDKMIDKIGVNQIIDNEKSTKENMVLKPRISLQIFDIFPGFDNIPSILNNIKLTNAVDACLLFQMYKKYDFENYYFYVFSKDTEFHVVLIHDGIIIPRRKFEEIGELPDDKKIEFLLVYEHYRYLLDFGSKEQYEEIMNQIRNTSSTAGKPKRSLRKRRKTDRTRLKSKRRNRRKTRRPRK